jgi:hypothetical protein
MRPLPEGWAIVVSKRPKSKLLRLHLVLGFYSC